MNAPYAKLPGWADYGLIPLVNLIVAFFVAGLVVLLVGENPFEAAVILVKGALGGGQNIAYTLYYATNFIFTGLAVAIAFHCSLFNIGGEGQAYVGGLGLSLVCLAFDGIFPWWINFPLAIVASALFGALWALIPAYLQAKRGSHIVITTIMFNFIAASLMVYLLVGPLKPFHSQAPQTRDFLPGGQLPKLGFIFEWMGMRVRTAPFNVSFLLALAASVFVWLLVWRTRFGYELRTMGFSPEAARYAGINEPRIIIITMMISGALAGLMSINVIMGDQHHMALDFASGAGFVGIAVALMGRSHPFGIIPAAILFGMLYQGGADLSFEMPEISRDMIVIIQGLVILFAGAL
ncbi:MAG: ABC transporter permease, partial [Hyphomicrobiales bacterium]|nr:ABC transporter permease [Hyphomicrobiales bacterium]